MPDDSAADAQRGVTSLQEELDVSRRRAATLEGELKGLQELQRKLISGSCGHNKEVVLQLQQLLAVKCRGDAAKDVRLQHALQDRDEAVARAERAEKMLRLHEGLRDDNLVRLRAGGR